LEDTEDAIIATLVAGGHIHRNSHFVYAAGDHGEDFVNIKGLSGAEVEAFAQLLARRLVDTDVRILVGVETGGIPLAHAIACHLKTMDDYTLTVLIAQKRGGGKFFLNKKARKQLQGRRCVVVEDVVNSGASVHTCVGLVRTCGPRSVGVVAVVNRGPSDAASLGADSFACLATLRFPKWPPGKGSCPLCDADVPVNEQYGRGRQYLAAQRALAMVPDA